MDHLEKMACPFFLQCKEENKTYKATLKPESYERLKNPMSEKCHENYGGQCEEHIAKRYSGLL